jgi:hypothetical protein
LARGGSRVAACAGITLAVLLIGAPGAAVSVADPGGSGRHSNHGGGGEQSGGAGGHVAAKKPGDNGPRVTIGSGRGDNARGGSTVHPAGPHRPPTVTVGDGRSPHADPPAGPPPQLDSPPPAQPAPPPPPHVVAPPAGRPWSDPLTRSALVRLQGVQSDPITDPLLGLAGLVLLPAAGALLGYRQAKAAQAARALGRRDHV